MPPTCRRHRVLKNSSRPRAPLDLFSTVREASERAADRRFANRNPARGKEELSPLGVGSPRALSEVFCQEPSHLLVHLRLVAGSLPGLEVAALMELLAVAFDRCAIYPETVGGLALRDALLHRLDYLLPEI